MTNKNASNNQVDVMTRLAAESNGVSTEHVTLAMKNKVKNDLWPLMYTAGLGSVRKAAGLN